MGRITVLISVKTFFFFLRRSPDFGKKNRLNFSKDLFFFFGDHQILGRRSDSISVKTTQNLDQDCLILFPASKTAPCTANSWLRYGETSELFPFRPRNVAIQPVSTSSHNRLPNLENRLQRINCVNLTRTNRMLKLANRFPVLFFAFDPLSSFAKKAASRAEL